MFVYEPNKRYISVDSDVLQNNVKWYLKLFLCTKNNFEIKLISVFLSTFSYKNTVYGVCKQMKLIKDEHKAYLKIIHHSGVDSFQTLSRDFS